MRSHLLSALALVAAINLPAAAISISDFTGTPGITLAGTASVNGTALDLTARTTSQAGAMWVTAALPVNVDFTSEFRFRIIPPTSGVPADGLAFVIQNFANNVVGDAGGGIAYTNLRGLAVEFDTFTNSTFGDPNANHVAVQSCGATPTINTADQTSAGCNKALQSSPGVTLADGNAHTARIVHAGGSLSVLLDGVQIIAPFVINLGSLANQDGTAFVGLTAATGAATSIHRIESFSFNNVPEPAAGPLMILGLAALALGRCRRKQ